MLSECSNSSCSAPFRYLGKGKLFRLEDQPARSTCQPIQEEYFWLCERCSATMTLRLGPDNAVVAVLIPERIRGVPECVALISVDQKRGLLLRSLSSSLANPRGGRARARIRDEQHGT